LTFVPLFLLRLHGDHPLMTRPPLLSVPFLFDQSPLLTPWYVEDVCKIPAGSCSFLFRAVPFFVHEYCPFATPRNFFFFRHFFQESVPPSPRLSWPSCGWVGSDLPHSIFSYLCLLSVVRFLPPLILRTSRSLLFPRPLLTSAEHKITGVAISIFLNAPPTHPCAVLQPFIHFCAFLVPTQRGTVFLWCTTLFSLARSTFPAILAR